MDSIQVDWRKPTVYSECTWHQIAPYIGKMKSSMASSLIRQFTEPGQTIYDPFAGAGTIGLEGWIAGRPVVCGDLSPYAVALTRAKLRPPRDAEDAIQRLEASWAKAVRLAKSVDLGDVPTWVSNFFHRRTLREVLALRTVLLGDRQWFLLSCMLGILHHWRPAFLSHPASHTVPYLMKKRFPRTNFPEMYAYKPVYPRLLLKVHRAFLRTPDTDRHVRRVVRLADAAIPRASLSEQGISAIITSPPYMNSLSYARDNRLRLWFLGVPDHRLHEAMLSPNKPRFLRLMGTLLPQWADLLPRDAPVVLVLGAVRRDGRSHDLPDAVVNQVRERRCELAVTAVCRNVIPDSRRTRGNCRSIRQDTIIVLRKRA